MTFIDWSDPEEMLGLLAEYVADARSDSREDAERTAALASLRDRVTRLARVSDTLSLAESIDELREIRASLSADLGSDPVLLHVAACIDELERIQADQGA